LHSAFGIDISGWHDVIFLQRHRCFGQQQQLQLDGHSNRHEAPTIDSVVPTPATLWPPNHKLAQVSVVVTATDICDPNPTCQITSVASSEAADAHGSGNTSPDFIVTNPGPAVSPAHLGVQLRAERAGGGSGRTCTITVQCSDASHNSSTATTIVTVPHDQGH
jgi:hypothetical protein